MLKHLGLLSIVAMWIGTYLLLRSHLPDAGKTISRHAAKSTRYHVLYGVLEVAVVSLFSWFMFGWFIPTYELGAVYVIAAIVGFLGTVTAAFIADKDGWRSKVHGFGAYSMALSLFIMNLLLLFSAKVHTVTQFFIGISLTYMIAIVVVVALYPRLYRRNTLKIQVSYFLAFHVPILFAVYV